MTMSMSFLYVTTKGTKKIGGDYDRDTIITDLREKVQSVTDDTSFFFGVVKRCTIYDLRSTKYDLYGAVKSESYI